MDYNKIRMYDWLSLSREWQPGSRLYYVESVQEIGRSEDGEAQARLAVLQYIPESWKYWKYEIEALWRNRPDNRAERPDFRSFRAVMLSQADAEIVREGHYVYFDKHNGFMQGDGDRRAMTIGQRAEVLMAELRDNIAERREADERTRCEDVDEALSFHVNVGHGNLSLIAFRNPDGVHIWLIDCSNYDYLVRKGCNDKTQNIEACLRRIKRQFQLKGEPKVEVAMLTHPHYDHYSGFRYFINRGYIDSNTLFYLNLRYSVKSHNFNNLLAAIARLNVAIVAPLREQSNSTVKILYPEGKTFSNALSLNNQSSVYNILIDGESQLLFPGDLETQGWELMGHACMPNMHKPRYYAVSHHGSLNGHLRPTCPMGRAVGTVADCLPKDTKAILMGRDGAYPGIYNQRVITDFRGRLLKTEETPTRQPARFLEIDLLRARHRWD